jgi:hypothetical protein
MAKTEHKRNIDTILLYLLIKKLTQPITKSEAFKLKLVNNVGKVIKEPKTEKEQQALTLLDRFCYKLKRLLNVKLITLNNYLYLQILNNDFYNKLIVKGSVEQRSELERIKKDVTKQKLENNNINIDDIIMLLTEEYEENNENI